jgi:hypothetical protein
MAGFDLAKVKKSFFNAKLITDPVERAKLSVLARFGAFVRQRAKTSMRWRKGTSPVGSPPFAHIGAVRRLTFFAIDPLRGTVVVGPVRFQGRGEGARALEEGGTSWSPKLGRVRIRRRAFMVPALLKELPGLSRMFAGSVRG